MKIPSRILLGLLIVILTAAILVSVSFTTTDKNQVWYRTGTKYRDLEQAIHRSYLDERVTHDGLERVQTIDDLAALVVPYLEDPLVARFDAKRQPLIFDREERDDRIIITLKSTIVFNKEWHWDKDPPPLAMEIVVFRDREKGFQVNQLWHTN